MPKAVAAITFLVGIGIGIVMTVSMCRGRGERLTLTSLSPDDHLRVRLVEVSSGRIDRNFELRLEDLAGRATKTLFRSPDEGMPEGSERIVWASDGSRFVLVGRHFFLRDGPHLATGESLYLMYNVETGGLWCNSPQSKLPPFSLRDLEGTRWREPFLPTTLPATRQHVPGVVR